MRDSVSWTSVWEGIVRFFPRCGEMTKSWSKGHYLVGAPAQEKLQLLLEREVTSRTTITTTRDMTAIESVIMSLVRAGETIACSVDVYPGTRAYLEELKSQGYLSEIRWFDPSDPEISLNHGQPKLIFVETFGNARQMRTVDISALLAWKEHHLPDSYLVVDTTFTPFFMPPFRQDVVVVCSMTKYFQPGDEQMGGFVAGYGETIEKIRSSRIYQNLAMLPSVAEYFLGQLQRGKAREYYQLHCRNARTLAEICQGHPAVQEVWYPGLQIHPQFNLVVRDHEGLGGGVFYLQLWGGEKAAIQLANELAANYGETRWHIAVSFGSADWRIFPFIGEVLRAGAGCEGLVRIASGRIDHEPNIHFEAFKRALDSLVS